MIRVLVTTMSTSLTPGKLWANNVVKTRSSNIGKIIVSKPKNNRDSLQIEIPNDCNPFYFD